MQQTVKQPMIPLIALLLVSVQAALAGSLTLRAIGPDGKPLPRAHLIYVSDINYNPVAVIGDAAGPAKTLGDLPDEPLLLCAYLEVPGYGNLNFTAANGGAGYLPNGQTLDILVEAARHRCVCTDRLMRRSLSNGYKVSRAVRSRIAETKRVLAKAEASEPGSAAQAARAMKALEIICPISEELPVDIGRQKLDRQGGLGSEKLVSAFAIYAEREGRKWYDAMAPLFNCAVVNWQWQDFVLPDGGCDWTADPYGQDEVVRKMEAMCKRMRGVTGMWLNSLPAWCKNPTVDDLKKIHAAYAQEIAERYPQVEYWQIASEMTGSWDNLGFLQPEDLLALTRAVSEATHRANPKAKRGVNSVLVWGEEVPQHFGKEPRTIAPYNFHRMLNDCKIPYEFIVIQVYFQGWDIFEVDRMLEVFRKLGKPIHIELECASANRPMPQCLHFPQGHPGMLYYTWHRPWDERLQADWLERMFIVCLSKDYVSEWCWWDIADYQDCYYPWGGLMDKDYKPKESYRRLQELIHRWRGK